MMIGAEKGHVAVCTTLLDKGASVDRMNKVFVGETVVFPYLISFSNVGLLPSHLMF